MTKSSTIEFACRILAVMALLPCLAFADEKEDREADDKLAALAVESREAIVAVNDGPWAGLGAFISADGLALIHLQAFMGKDKPQVSVSGELRPKFGKILGIFPEQELALVKIEHRPKTWLRMAPAEPELGDTVALVTLKLRDVWSDKVPPVIGRILAKRSSITANLKEPRFYRALSLGAGLSTTQTGALGPGCFTIDSDGRLVAFLTGRRRSGGQTLIYLAPIAALAAEIENLSKRDIDLGHPLPPKHNPVDPASIDPDFHPMGMAIAYRDSKKAKRLLDNLDQRHPGSFLLKQQRLIMIASEMAAGDQEDLGLQLPKPDPDDPVAYQAIAGVLRSRIFQMRLQNDAAERESKTVIGFSPDDFPDAKQDLAALRASQGRFDDAEKILREIFPLCSDSIQFVELLERILMDQGNWKEAQKMTERVFELEEIYSTPR